MPAIVSRYVMNHSPPTPLSHLSRVWKVFCGEDLDFVSCLTNDVPGQQDMCFRLGVTVQPGDTLEHGLALLLLLSREDAVTLASMMFDLPLNGIEEADLTDACNEMCNVLANRGVLGLTPEQPFDIGPVKQLSGSEYVSLLQRTEVRSHYCSFNHTNPLSVLVCESPKT